MFDIKRTHPVIPGYTGFLPKTFGESDGSERPKPHGELPGYAGFVHSIKAENLFAKPYGKITYISSSGEHEKGAEIPNNFRYTSTLQDSFVNQRNVTARTVAEIVGVVPKKTIYTETGPFHISAEAFNRTDGFGKTAQSEHKRGHSLGDSTNLFFGQEKAQHQIGNPVPGYTGVSRRVVADNIFGCTYAEGRRRGAESHGSVTNDKATNLMTQSKMVPPVRK